MHTTTRFRILASSAFLAVCTFAGCADVGGDVLSGADAGDATHGSGAIDGAGNDPVAPPIDDVESPSTICTEPEPWPVPTEAKVVGTGTAASCTEGALRAALEGGGHVTFSCGEQPVTIVLTESLQITETTVLDGGGGVTLDGAGTVQILVVRDNRSLSVRNLHFLRGRSPEEREGAGIGGAVSGRYRSAVEVRNCTFEDNVAARGGGAVAVWTGSRLVVTGSKFVGNKAWYGGALYSLLSPLTVVNSVFVANSTKYVDGFGNGGAIGTDGASELIDDDVGGDIVLCGAKINDNRAFVTGGGAYLWVYPPDRVLIDRTTVAQNHVREGGEKGAAGGGMRVSNGHITVTHSSFFSNTADQNAGGLYLDYCEETECKIINSSFHDNKAVEGYGGAVFGDEFSIFNTTFSKNFAGGHGGALFGEGHKIRNTMFVDNSAGNPWHQAMSCGSKGTGSHVLQWLTESSNGGDDQCIEDPLVADPQLHPPADNGGDTPTMTLGANSPALGAGADCETTDQRGHPRDVARCDLGSVEMQ